MIEQNRKTLLVLENSRGKMTNSVNIHAELASIMEILAKSAVAEISKLVDDGAAFLRLEISRSHREIVALKRQLHLMERELTAARNSGAPGRTASRAAGAPVCDGSQRTQKGEEHTPPVERVFGQEWSFGVWRDAETTAVEEESTPLQSVMREESADMEENTPESLLIKEERLEDNLWSRDPQPTPAEEQVAQPTPAEHPKKHVTQHTPGEEQVTQLTPPEEQVAESIPAGDPEELGEKHRCGHSEEDLSGLEFVVKAEQEEEHVAQRLSQTGFEHNAGRLNNLDPEYVTYERDGQLWTSFTPGDSDIETDDPVCDNATEQYSQSLSVHTELQHIPPTLDNLSSLGSIDAKGHIAMFDTVEKEEEVKALSVCSGELRSGAAPAHQWQYRERLSSLAHNNLTSQSQQQHHQSNPDPRDVGHSLSANNCSMERKAKPHRRASAGEKRFSCSQCGKNFTTRFYLKIHRRIHTGERPFNCTQCGKRFYCTSHLTSHQRSHTGEKPYSCDECGNSYSHLNSLKLHYRVHSDERVNCS